MPRPAPDTPPDGLAASRERPLLAVACLCAGVGVFSVQDLLIKVFADRYPITEAMTVRAVVALPLLWGLVTFLKGTGRLRSPHWGLLALRAAIAFSAYMAYYLAIAALPLAEAAALFFTAPLIISGLAVMVLGEPLRRHTVLALVAGFAGVVVVLRPGAGVFEWAGLLVVLSATLYGTAQILTRRIGAAVPAPVITFYQNLAFLGGAPLLAALLALWGPGAGGGHPSLDFLLRPWAWPTIADGLMMAACGVIAAAAMTLLSQAYRLAAAARVAIFEYTAILWAPLWGFLFFAEVPTSAAVAGAALICGAGLFALRRDLAEEPPAADAPRPHG